VLQFSNSSDRRLLKGNNFGGGNNMDDAAPSEGKAWFPTRMENINMVKTSRC